MPNNKLQYLSRAQYIASIALIEDKRSTLFANMSLDWWDKRFGWYEKGCVALSSEDGVHLCYIFYKIDRYNNYLTIHNILTPDNKRRHGYAEDLLLLIFELALKQKVKRFRLTCISSSLDFYLSLGFVYWGVNSVGDYYCDLPMPHSGLHGVTAMTKESTPLELSGKNFDIISKKIEEYSLHLSSVQQLKYDSDIIKLGSSYLHKSFLEIREIRMLNASTL